MSAESNETWDLRSERHEFNNDLHVAMCLASILRGLAIEEESKKLAVELCNTMDRLVDRSQGNRAF